MKQHRQKEVDEIKKEEAKEKKMNKQEIEKRIEELEKNHASDIAKLKAELAKPEGRWKREGERILFNIYGCRDIHGQS